MPKRTPPTHPAAQRQIDALGARLRAARLRRKLTQAMLAARVGVSIPTIGKLESGDPTTSLSTTIRVLQVLGLGSDLDLLASNDTLGHSLQDSRLTRPSTRSSAPGSVKPPARDRQ